MVDFDGLLNASGWRGRGLDMAVGGAAVLGLAPFFIWPLALLCFGWLALRLDRRAKAPINASKLCRSSGFWFALGYFLFGLFWIGSAFIARGPSYIPLMIPAVLLLCALLSLFWTIAAHSYARLNPRGLWAPILFASVMSATEILRGHLLSGFPWNLPGYIFKSGGAVSQSASIIGIYGLTFLTFLLAGSLAHCLKPRHTPLQGSLPISAQTPRAGLERPSGLIFLVTLIGLFSFGFIRLAAADDIIFHDGITLRIVQTPFAQKDNLDPGGSVAIANDYLAQTAAPGLEAVTHVIWPEGAVNGLALENTALIRAVSDLFLSFDNSPPDWLVNSLREETRPSPQGQPIDYYYNSSASVDFGADGSVAIAAINDKVKLVPFGEGLPGGRFLERYGIAPMSTAASFVTAAPKKEIANFPGLPPLTAHICYEIIFPGLTPRPKNAPNPQWILNQSNDGWYGKSSGPQQHANQAAYRAIEEGLPIVRSAGNGISGVIDPYGRWHVRAEPHDEIALDSQLPIALAKPLFSINLIWVLFLINTTTCLVYLGRWGRRHTVDVS